MTEPRDEYGDKLRPAEIEHDWAARDADRRMPLRTRIRLHTGTWVARWREEQP